MLCVFSEQEPMVRPRSQTMPPSILKNSGEKQKAPKIGDIVSMMLYFKFYIIYGVNG